MFGKRTTAVKNETEQLKKEVTALKQEKEANTPDLVVEQPKTVGMPGFTEDPKPAEAPEPVKVEAPKPVAPEKPAEQYQIVEVGLAPTEGLYVYKVVTNKYLGELGGIYEA